jgi:hypothetical protein
MAAWIKAWGSYIPLGEKSARDNPVQSRSYMKPDMVMILAGMALSCTKGEEDDG